MTGRFVASTTPRMPMIDGNAIRRFAPSSRCGGDEHGCRSSGICKGGGGTQRSRAKSAITVPNDDNEQQQHRCSAIGHVVRCVVWVDFWNFTALAQEPDTIAGVEQAALIDHVAFGSRSIPKDIDARDKDCRVDSNCQSSTHLRCQVRWCGFPGTRSEQTS